MKEDQQLLAALYEVREAINCVVDAGVYRKLSEAIQQLETAIRSDEDRNQAAERAWRLQLIGEVIKCLPEYLDLLGRYF